MCTKKKQSGVSWKVKNLAVTIGLSLVLQMHRGQHFELAAALREDRLIPNKRELQ